MGTRNRDKWTRNRESGDRERWMGQREMHGNREKCMGTERVGTESGGDRERWGQRVVETESGRDSDLGTESVGTESVGTESVGTERDGDRERWGQREWGQRGGDRKRWRQKEMGTVSCRPHFSYYSFTHVCTQVQYRMRVISWTTHTPSHKWQRRRHLRHSKKYWFSILNAQLHYIKKVTAYYFSFARLTQRREHGIGIVEIGVGASRKAFAQNVEHCQHTSLLKSPVPSTVLCSAPRQPYGSFIDIKIVACTLLRLPHEVRLNLEATKRALIRGPLPIRILG